VEDTPPATGVNDARLCLCAVSGPRVLVLGGAGLVGSRFRELAGAELELDAPTRAELDVLDDAALAAYVRRSPADVVLNLVAVTDLDGQELERGDTGGLAFRTNALLVRRLAELCGEHHKHLVHVSTDYVFDGEQAERPYVETDPVHPLCWYAQTKLQGEAFALESGASVTIARIEMPFTGRPHRKSDFPRLLVGRLRAGLEVVAVTDQKITPVFLDDAAGALSELVRRRPTGVLHVASTDWTTPYEFARAIAGRLGLDAGLIRPDSFDRFAATRRARRPRHSWLDVTAFGRLSPKPILRSVAEEVAALAEQLRATA
jgi:dTDP-4-dehydrorhamnose reductase